jgi:hypothetical protein
MSLSIGSGINIVGGISIVPATGTTIPDNPIIGSATATGGTTASVSFTAPTDNGGSTILSYTATSKPGAITSTLNQAGSGTITVTGLSQGATYTFTVTATNSIGTSSPSTASNSITTYILPTNTVAPVVSGTATVGQLLSTTDGTWDGAAPISYTYQWQRNNVNISSATSSTYTLVDADVGNPIRCVVTGTNSYGNSSANSNSTANVSPSVPGSPTIGTATATGESTATVSFTAPASNGGSTILSYTATSSPGSLTGTLTQAGSGTISVIGLTPSTSYTFTVTATNSLGTGNPSAASNSITTNAPPAGAKKAIFGFGQTSPGSNVSMTNLVSYTGVVATDTSSVGTVRYGLAASGYGGDKAIFGYGLGSVGGFSTYYSLTNLVSNTGVVATDTSGVGTARGYLAAAGYGGTKAIFGYGNFGGSATSLTNLVSNTGVVATNTTGVGTARGALAAAGYSTT